MIHVILLYLFLLFYEGGNLEFVLKLVEGNNASFFEYYITITALISTTLHRNNY